MAETKDTDPLSIPSCSFHQASPFQSSAIPLGYSPLFPATNGGKSSNSFGHTSLFPASESGNSSLIGFKPLFPVTEDDSEAKQTNSKNYDWLNFSSITTDELITDLKEIENKVDKSFKQEQPEKDEYYHVSRSSKSKKKRVRLPSPKKEKFEIEQELIAQSTRKVFIEDTGLSAEHAFRVDRKFDQTNLSFPTFNPIHTAKYYKDPNKPPLGLTSAEEGKWIVEKRGKVKKGQKNAQRYCSQQNAKVIYNEEGILDYSKSSVLSGIKKFEDKRTVCAEYLPMELSASEVKQNTTKVDNNQTKSYLEMNTENEKDNSKNEGETTMKESHAQYINRRTTEFNQQLRESPKDEKKWLEFIKFQDKAIALSFDNQQSEKKLSERGIFERKLSIIDKALETIPSSVTLYVTKLKLCQNYWETADLKKEWNKLLFMHPNNIYAWESYLLYLQSHFSSFTFSTVVKGYAKCFAKLNSILEGTLKSHDAPDDFESKMLGVLLKFGHFLSQAGHREKAIACFQAMIEFNCFTPKNLNFSMSLQDWMAFFEPYWDSGVARFGEDGSIGWSALLDTKQLPERNSSDVTDEDKAEDEIIQLNLSRHQTWLRLEKLKEDCHWLPWKPSIEETADDCEDPDRMVLFDDVSPFLFRLKTNELKYQLAQVFLSFLGQIRDPHFVTECSIVNCHCSRCIESSSSMISRCNYLEYKFDVKNQMPSLVNDDDNLLLSNVKFEEFVDRVTSQFVSLFEEPQKSEFQVQWLQRKRLNYCAKKDREPKKAKQLLKDTRKFCKNLLKEEANRNKLPLWLEYSKLELDSGHIDDARKVFEMITLTHPPNASFDQDSDLCKVYKMYSELEVTQKEKCLTILSAFAINEPTNSVSKKLSPSILKAKRQYQSSQDSVFKSYCEQIKLSSTDLFSSAISYKTSFLVEWFPCCALFSYLTAGIQPAIIVYEGILNKLSDLVKDTNDDTVKTKVKLDMEQIYLSYIKLVLHHVNTTTSSLKIIRSILHGALLLFPQNYHFLRLMLDIESRSHIAGHLRRHFTRSLKVDDSPIICFYAVMAELRRLQNLRQCQISEGGCDFENGITQRIQSIFEQALLLPECENCPLLWRLYLKFQIELGNGEKAKAVFYRAMQHCVWNKKIYLDAAQIPDLLQEILDIMTEKEIRIRIPIEEVDLLQKAEALKNNPENNGGIENNENIEQD